MDQDVGCFLRAGVRVISGHSSFSRFGWSRRASARFGRVVRVRLTLCAGSLDCCDVMSCFQSVSKRKPPIVWCETIIARHGLRGSVSERPPTQDFHNSCGDAEEGLDAMLCQGSKRVGGRPRWTAMTRFCPQHQLLISSVRPHCG